MRATINLLLSALLLAVLLGGSSCSLIGYGLGYAVDASNVRIVETGPDNAMLELSVGDSILVLLRGGEEVRGVHAGTEIASLDILHGARDVGSVDPASYRTAVLPGDTLLMERSGRPSAHVIYIGAEPRRLLYADSTHLAVRPLLFEHITRLARIDGRIIETPYHDRIADGTFGRRALLPVRVDGAIRLIDTSTVDTVRFERTPKGGRTAGFTIGLLGDIAMIFLATFEYEMKLDLR